MSYRAKRALLFAFIILAAIAAWCVYAGLMLSAMIFGVAAFIPFLILSAVGWAYVLEALDNGKVP